MKELLIVVDMQNDFLTGPLGNAQTVACIPFVKKEIARARAFNVEVVFTRDTHASNYMSTQEGKNLPVVHCIKGSDGWKIADGLYRDGEKIFDKPTFGSLELAQYVAKGKYGKVTLVGVCTDICVVSNALLIKAYAPETEVYVKASACAGVSEESHESAIKTMASCQVKIV